MSKSLLIGAIRSVAPDLRGEVAKSIADSILETISSELVSQGSFTLQKIGSLTLTQKPSRKDNAGAGLSDVREARERRVPGVEAKYHVSRFLTDRLRRINASRHDKS